MTDANSDAEKALWALDYATGIKGELKTARRLFTGAYYTISCENMNTIRSALRNLQSQAELKEMVDVLITALETFKQRIQEITDYSSLQNLSTTEHTYMKGYYWALEKFGNSYLLELNCALSQFRESEKRV
jgi:hypothetical protein